jgi:SAM-dependent methyltransferase
VAETGGGVASVSQCPEDCEFQHGPTGVKVCQKCGLGRTAGETRPPYQQIYHYSEADEHRARVNYLRWVWRRYLQKRSPGILLDVGCGSGLLLDIAERGGWEVHGIDTAPPAREDPRIWHGEFLVYLGSSPVNAIALIHSFEHMTMPRNTVQQCYRLLTPGGFLVVIVPNFGGAWARLDGADWAWLNASEHCFHWTPKALSNLILSEGFQVETLETCSAGAPSVAAAWVSARGLYGLPVLGGWPLRGVMFRLANALRQPINRLTDAMGAGAQVCLVARRV